MCTNPKPFVLLACLALVACGGDGGGDSADSADAADTSDVLEAGPSDDAGRIDVTVDERAPRGFRMGVGAPTDGLDSEFGTRSWQFANANADVLTIRLSGGLPWAEILAGTALPPTYEAQLADLADRAAQTGADVLLIVDPLNGERDGLAADALGRAEPELANLRFSDAALRAGYTSFCEGLAQRFEPRYFSPFVAINLYGARQPEDAEALRTLYESLREAVKFASNDTLVFPIWDFEQVRQTVASGNATQLAVFDELDEALDFFAVDFRPALQGRNAADLDDDVFDIIDRNRTGSLTTRKVAIVDAGYPAAGVVQAGEVFASSENSQFNYLAFVLAAGDRLDMEFVSWRTPVDPDRWLLTPCEAASEGSGEAGDIEGCDADRIEAIYGEQRRHGLLDSDGDERAARRLWEQYYSRVFVP